MNSSADLPPGPRGQFRILRQMLDNLPAFFEAVHRDYGDIACFKVLGNRVCIVSSAELVKEVLGNPSIFAPEYPSSRYDITKFPGLARMRGENHPRLAKLIISAFSPKRMQVCADIAAEQIEERCGALEAGQEFDTLAFFERLSWELSFGAVFGRDMRPGVENGRAIINAIKLNYVFSSFPGGPTISRFPWPYALRSLRAARNLDPLAREAIRRARDSGHPGHDAVSHLIRATEGELVDWRFEDDSQIRDQGYDLVLSYELLISSLVYSMHYLSRNPGVREKLEDEVDRVVGNRPVRGADFANLRYTRAVLQELMRVESPATSMVPRPALEDTTLAGYFIPRGTVVQIPLRVLHSRADYWERAGEFLPERWLEDSSLGCPAHPDGSFAPFSLEPRACRGAPFATMAMTLTLASVARRLRLEPVVADIPERLSLGVAFFGGPVHAKVTGRADAGN